MAPTVLLWSRGKLYNPAVKAVSESGVRVKAWRVILFLVAHAGLALAMSKVAAIGYLHGVVTLIGGIAYIFAKKAPERAAYAAAYMIGAEVLWRMTDTALVWEIGKYGTALFLLIGLQRMNAWKIHVPSTIYFTLLLPSGALTLAAMDLENARQRLSFNLSGPLTLMVCIWYFSNAKFTSAQLAKMFLCIIGPVVGIAAITIMGTYASGPINFTDDSNFATSGGFGPNQVSAALGLGTIGAFLLLVQQEMTAFLRLTLFGVMIVFMVQSAMTFSRGGLYSSVLAAAICTFYLLKESSSRKRLIPMLMALGAAVVIIMPLLAAFTGGALEQRFRDHGLTHRDEIMKADLEIWAEYPLFGVGPGAGRKLRSHTAHASGIAHTEFTRLVSEHGVFGLFSGIVLLGSCYARFLKGKSPSQRALSMWTVFWSCLYMSANAMRIGAPSFICGLGFLELVNSTPVTWYRMRLEQK